MTSNPGARAVLAIVGAGLLASACGNGMTTTGTTPSAEAPYGAWASPLTAARVTAGALRLGQIVLDGDDVYWLEGRAAEGGPQRAGAARRRRHVART